MSLQWYGPEIERQIMAEMRSRIRACVLLVANHAKRLVSTEGTGKRSQASRRIRTWKNGAGLVAGVQTRTLAGGKKQTWHGRYHRKSKGTLIYGKAPSKPGDPPHLQKGRLRGSIAWELVSQLVGRVGTNLKYGRALELGTSKMAARPWLRRALAEMQDKINRILGAPIKLK